jgi:hypothetical protein
MRMPLIVIWMMVSTRQTEPLLIINDKRVCDAPLLVRLVPGSGNRRSKGAPRASVGSASRLEPFEEELAFERWQEERPPERKSQGCAFRYRETHEALSAPPVAAFALGAYTGGG